MVTAAHAICKGRTHPIDIVSMLQPPSKRYFSFLSLSFGLTSNLDIGTEHLRQVLLDCYSFLTMLHDNSLSMMHDMKCCKSTQQHRQTYHCFAGHVRLPTSVVRYRLTRDAQPVRDKLHFMKAAATFTLQS